MTTILLTGGAGCVLDAERLKRFWAKVDKNGPTLRPELGPCWVWTAARMRNGYGYFAAERVGGRNKMKYAHRVAWELEHGPIGAGLCVMHRCDNPACVRADHLTTGTQRDNLADMVRKGREPRGERRGPAGLCPCSVRAARRLSAEGVSANELGRRFGVCTETICKMLRRETWRHVA
jgi:hypothetical protein